MPRILRVVLLSAGVAAAACLIVGLSGIRWIPSSNNCSAGFRNAARHCASTECRRRIGPEPAGETQADDAIQRHGA
jgi:hypothetical protein